MVTLLALIAIIIGVGLRTFYLQEVFVGSDEDKAEIKELSVYMILGGIAVILINSWIIRPLMMFIGG